MKIRKETKLFSIGTILLVVGLFCLTLLPKVIYSSFPTLFFPLEFTKKIVAILYIAAFLCYVFSPRYFAKQTFVIVVLYACYFGISY